MPENKIYVSATLQISIRVARIRDQLEKRAKDYFENKADRDTSLPIKFFCKSQKEVITRALANFESKSIGRLDSIRRKTDKTKKDEFISDYKIATYLLAKGGNFMIGVGQSRYLQGAIVSSLCRIFH